MSAFKKLKKSDVITIPYIANKSWNFSGTSEFLSSSYNIQAYLGQNLSGSDFDPYTESTSSIYYSRLVFNSIQQLYYRNFLESPIQESGSYDNFNQSTLKTYRFFPTGGIDTNGFITVISIPQELYGSKILPGSFVFSGSWTRTSTIPTSSISAIIIDDLEGNLYISGSSQYPTYVGNIIYAHGLAILTPKIALYNFPDISTGFTASISFKNEHIVYENEVRCLVREDEMNYSLNPTILYDSSGSLRDFATGSNFSPYTTTVGLYNEQNELLAVGKMSQPVPMSPSTDMTFIIRYDT